MNQLPWWNYKTQKFEFAAPDTDEIARQYFPQNDAADNLYGLWREAGCSVIEALANVLHQCNNEKPPFDRIREAKP